MKNILSVIAGLGAGVAVLIVLELLTAFLFPLPKGIDLSLADEETKEFLMQMMPKGVMIMLLSNYLIASLAGGFVSSLISKKIWHPLMVGGLLTVANIFNLMEVPHPFWLAVTSMFMFLPFAFLGGKIGLMVKKKSACV